MTLTEFLLARIGDDERVAREAQGETAHFSFDASAVPVREHIMRWTSARVLAEVAAKRRIVEIHCRMVHEMDNHYPVKEGWTRYVCARCGDSGEDTPVEFPCETLRLLALPYAEHESYRAEWKP